MPRTEKLKLQPSLRAAITALAIAMALIVGATQAAQAQTFTVLYNFTGGADGAYPEAGLSIDKGGNLYGTTSLGGHTGGNCGSSGCGVVFKLSPKGSGWIFAPLYAFQGGTDGTQPEARVIFGPNGSLYGTTVRGGYRGCNHGIDTCGTVFNLRPPASACKSALCPWAETVLYAFSAGSDGAYPQSEVVFDPVGNMYLSTGGDAGGCFSGPGIIVKLTPSNGGWKETLSYGFNGGNDGFYPSGLILDAAGNVYGVADGGVYNSGLAFELTTSGSGWTENVLYDFRGGNDGLYPAGGLTFDKAGNLYGGTAGGGGSGCYGGLGCGTVFELTPSSGGQWTESILYSFTGPSGQSTPGPTASLTMDSLGNLYGTTATGGAYGYGSAFKLTLLKGSWSTSISTTLPAEAMGESR